MITGLQINKKLIGEETIMEKLAKTKLWLFFMLHKLLSNTVCSVFLYQILVIIETIQMGYYSIHPKLNFFFKSQVLDTIRVMMEYFQVKLFYLKKSFSVVKFHDLFGKYQCILDNSLCFDLDSSHNFLSFFV